MEREDGFIENQVMEDAQHGSANQNGGFVENTQDRRYQVEAERRKREKKGYFFSGLAVGLAVALLIIGGVYLVTTLQQYIKYSKQQN